MSLYVWPTKIGAKWSGKNQDETVGVLFLWEGCGRLEQHPWWHGHSTQCNLLRGPSWHPVEEPPICFWFSSSVDDTPRMQQWLLQNGEQVHDLHRRRHSSSSSRTVVIRKAKRFGRRRSTQLYEILATRGVKERICGSFGASAEKRTSLSASSLPSSELEWCVTHRLRQLWRSLIT